MDSWFCLSFSPLAWICGIAGPEEAKNLSGGNILRLIRIRLTTAELGKNLVNRSRQFVTRSLGIQSGFADIVLRIIVLQQR
jgi:hypothetical protein